MSEVHAKLGASSAARWLACPPSVELTKDYPDSGSRYATEGTLAHALAEITLRKEYEKGFGQKTYERAREKAIHDITWAGDSLYSKDMDRYVDLYVNWIKSKAISLPHIPFICFEQRVNFDMYVPEGFGTADCIMVSDRDLYVVDLKYGKGVPVSAEDNPQLKLYGLGAYEGLKLLYDIRTVNLVIIQPRLDNISEWAINIADLREWGESIRPIAQQAFKGEGEFKAGEWCKFCKAKGSCRARADYSIQLAGFTKLKPDTLQNDEIGEYLEKGKEVASWLSDLQDYALNQCLNGNDIKGWKAVEGTSRRAWTNADEAFDAIIDSGVDEAMLYERKPLSLAQVEKLIGKKDFNEKFGNFVHKPAGKPTLVVESDKRDAISNVAKASDVFEKVGE